MEKQELEILEKQLQRLQKSILEQERNIACMESNHPLVLKYEGDKAVLAKNKEKYELMKKEYQQYCNHPLWYYMGMDLLCKENKINRISNFRMKCLKCGKEHVLSRENLWDCLIFSLINGNMKGKMLYSVFRKSTLNPILFPITTYYETIKQEFQGLKQNGIIEKEITQRLFNKYTVGEFNEEFIKNLYFPLDASEYFKYNCDNNIVHTYSSNELLSEEYQKLYYKLRNEGYHEIEAIAILEAYLEKNEDLARHLKIKYMPKHRE